MGLNRSRDDGIVLRVTGMTPTDCKHELLNELDARLAAWLASIAQGDSCSPAGLTPP
jgi:hypothetical protein